MPAPRDFAKLHIWGTQTKLNVPARFAQAFKLDKTGWVRFYVNDRGELCIKHTTEEEMLHARKKPAAAVNRPTTQPAPA